MKPRTDKTEENLGKPGGMYRAEVNRAVHAPLMLACSLPGHPAPEDKDGQQRGRARAPWGVNRSPKLIGAPEG